jgi:hypothetical protein
MGREFNLNNKLAETIWETETGNFLLTNLFCERVNQSLVASLSLEIFVNL